MNEKFYISISISLKFVPKSLIDYKSALVQVRAWCWTGNKPLPEPMLSQFTHWQVNSLGNDLVPSDNKPLAQPILTQIYVAIWCHLVSMNLPRQNGQHFADNIFKCIFLN